MSDGSSNGNGGGEHRPEGVGAGVPHRMDFSTLILSLLTSALIHLGELPDPAGGERTVRPEEARQAIALLEILEEKTRGNLTADEEKLLRQALTEVRFKYVQAVKERG